MSVLPTDRQPLPSRDDPDSYDTVVIYHGDGCHDGFGAAYAAWTVLGDAALYHPVRYGAKPADDTWPVLKGKRVIVLDYALDVNWVERVQREAASFVQLDHHDTAYQAYKARGLCGKECVFDLDRSGAMLAWQHFHGDKPAPTFLRNVEDFDLFRFREETTIPFSRGARSQPMTFEAWSTFESSSVYRDIVDDGRWMEAQWDEWLSTVEVDAWPALLLGEPVVAACANGAYRTELGNRLAKLYQRPALMWRGRPDGQVACSLRSIETPCKPLGERLGGGGHDHASGFMRSSLKDLAVVLGEAWADGAPQWRELMPARSEEEQDEQNLNRLKVWSEQAEKNKALRLDGRPHSALPPLNSPVLRGKVAGLLRSMRDVVVEQVAADAEIVAIPGHDGITCAQVMMDNSVRDDVVRRLLQQGHRAVQTVRVTARGVERWVSGDPIWALAAWPTTQNVPSVGPAVDPAARDLAAADGAETLRPTSATARASSRLKEPRR